VLARLLGNEVMAQLITDLLLRSQLIQLMYQSGHSAEHSQSEHVDIVEALAKRNGKLAGKLVEQHISSVERNLRLDPRTPDLAAVLRPAKT
jgi:DNA-binding GntR family transcriptional regulator